MVRRGIGAVAGLAEAVSLEVVAVVGFTTVRDGTAAVALTVAISSCFVCEGEMGLCVVVSV